MIFNDCFLLKTSCLLVIFSALWRERPVFTYYFQVQIPAPHLDIYLQESAKIYAKPQVDYLNMEVNIVLNGLALGFPKASSRGWGVSRCMLAVLCVLSGVGLMWCCVSACGGGPLSDRRLLPGAADSACTADHDC